MTAPITPDRPHRDTQKRDQEWKEEQVIQEETEAQCAEKADDQGDVQTTEGREDGTQGTPFVGRCQRFPQGGPGGSDVGTVTVEDQLNVRGKNGQRSCGASQIEVSGWKALHANQ